MGVRIEVKWKAVSHDKYKKVAVEGRGDSQTIYDVATIYGGPDVVYLWVGPKSRPAITVTTAEHRDGARLGSDLPFQTVY